MGNGMAHWKVVWTVTLWEYERATGSEREWERVRALAMGTAMVNVTVLSRERLSGNKRESGTVHSRAFGRDSVMVIVTVKHSGFVKGPLRAM